MMIFASLCAVVGLAFVHIWAGKLHLQAGLARSYWLSAAGGVSVAYVFVHLLPELGADQDIITEEVNEALAWLEHHVYLVALAGLATFYGLEHVAKESRKRTVNAADATSQGIFWMHSASFAAYNALVGYLLLYREDQDLTGLVFFAIAMALHFMGNDYSLHDHHKELYARIGRWLLAGAVLFGWGLGLVLDVSDLTLAMLRAFLTGGLILNILKEELPEERESNFMAFVVGAGIYVALLLIV